MTTTAKEPAPNVQAVNLLYVFADVNEAEHAGLKMQRTLDELSNDAKHLKGITEHHEQANRVVQRPLRMNPTQVQHHLRELGKTRLNECIGRLQRGKHVFTVPHAARAAQRVPMPEFEARCPGEARAEARNKKRRTRA